ncbi:MAG: ABC transporter ATP-binding protein, partial [Actinomycetota bacterium]|nr:ABC transporter ATP-binding protein [Actinomycetota bacterium]
PRSAAAADRGPAPPIVELAGITKRYPGVVANRDVSLRIDTGRVHAVVGENGAGKSTLMKILYGLVEPDEGTITVRGERKVLDSPSAAIAAGIGMVHQHVKLADNFTVLENVILGEEPTSRFGRLDLRRAERELADLCDRHGFTLRPNDRVGELGVGVRQRIELVKALFRGAEVLVLDEPTALLTPQESHDLLAHLRSMAASGLAVVFISHKLDEVLEVADDITVMRRGMTVATTTPAETSAAELARLMVGAEPVEVPPRHGHPSADVALHLQQVCVEATATHGGLTDIDLDLRRGEIVGVAGVEGNGQDELIDAVLGLRAITSGQLLMDGTDATHASTRARRIAGLGVIPTDRHREGLLLDAPLWESRILGQQTSAPIASGQWLHRSVAQREAREVVERADVRTPSVEVFASALSGGNQQKFIVGRELAGNPSVLIAAHPTRGVDIGAQRTIWRELADARDGGLATLLVTADLEELLVLSDRIVVLLRGRIVARYDSGEVGMEELGRAMTGAVSP